MKAGKAWMTLCGEEYPSLSPKAAKLVRVNIKVNRAVKRSIVRIFAMAVRARPCFAARRMGRKPLCFSCANTTLPSMTSMKKTKTFPVSYAKYSFHPRVYSTPISTLSRISSYSPITRSW